MTVRELIARLQGLTDPGQMGDDAATLDSPVALDDIVWTGIADAGVSGDRVVLLVPSETESHGHQVIR